MRRGILTLIAVAGLVATVVAGGSAATTAAASHPANVQPAEFLCLPPQLWQDFNGDGYDDLAIGAPFDTVNGKKGAGVVNVLYGSMSGLKSAHRQVFSQATAGLNEVPEAGDHFGFSLAAGDFDCDGFPDLAVGVPGQDLNGKADRGVVDILYGSAAGLVTDSRHHRLGPGQFALSHAGHTEFGYSLAGLDAVVGTTGVPGSDGLPDLAIGVPGDAGGAVALAYGSQLDPDFVTASVVDPVFRPDVRLGARAGSSLARGNFDSNTTDELVIGAPLEDVATTAGTAVDAGAVAVLWNGASCCDVFQQGDEFFGTPRSGDHFGAAVATGLVKLSPYDSLFIGEPDRDLGGKSNAGQGFFMPSLPNGSGLDTSTQWEPFSANDNGWPGPAQAGDRFGASLAVADFGRTGGAFGSSEDVDLAIGLPGRNVGVRAGAGAVMVLYGNDTLFTTTGIQRWTQNSAMVLDSSEAGDHFGASLFAADFDNNGPKDLAIGVPNEDLGSHPNAGAVSVLYGSSANGLRPNGNQLWTQGAGGAGQSIGSNDRFGSAMR